MRTLRIAVVALIGVYGLPARAQDFLLEGSKAELRGDLQGAVSHYNNAVQAAHRQADKTQESTALLKYGHAVEAWALDANQTTQIPQALDSYRRVLQIGTAQQKATAQNELGVLLLSQGSVDEAAAVLRQPPGEGVDPGQRSLLSFNFARVLERMNNPAGAFRAYLDASIAQPRFAVAAVAALRIARGVQPAPVGDIERLADQLLTTGQVDLVDQGLHDILPAWAARNDPQVDPSRLLRTLVRCYRAKRAEPSVFDRTEGPFLAHLASADQRFATKAAEIRKAYLDEFPPPMDPQRARQLFSEWQHDQSFSGLLKAVGEFYDRVGHPDRALSRFMAAWMLDPMNQEAAVLAAAVLYDHASQVDHDGRVLQKLVDGLFAAKGMAYEQNDLLNAMRLHVVLGTIFTRQRRWGPEADSHSALFQWQHAYELGSQLRSRTRKPAPGIARSLAEAYEHLGGFARARDLYVESAEGFLGNGNPLEARKSLAGFQRLAGPSDAAMVQRVGAVYRNLSMQGVLAGARLSIQHRDRTGARFVPTKVSYWIDGALVFEKRDDQGGLSRWREFPVYDGSMPPGEHTVSVVMEYVDGVKHTKVGSHGTYTITASDASRSALTVEVDQRGDRPGVDFQVARDPSR